MRVETNKTQETKSTGLTKTGAALVAIATLLLITGSAQAWWGVSAGFYYEAPDGKIWTCYPYDQYIYPVPGGALWYCHCFHRWGSGYGEYTDLGWHWFFFDTRSYSGGYELKLLGRGGW